jgi:cytidylate kinase
MSGRVIAIDGPAASGKSSTARAVAEALGWLHLDSGALYRGVTRVAIDEAAALGAADQPLGVVSAEQMLRGAEERGLALFPDGHDFAPYLDGEPAESRIRDAAVTAHVSAVSALSQVREWVNAVLRTQVRSGRDVVVDGRDIGTVVFPEAPLKVFLTASPEVRAHRRLAQRGTTIDRAELLRETALLAARDHADASRALAPLRRPDDAIDLDSSQLTFADQVARIIGLARERALDS